MTDSRKMKIDRDHIYVMQILFAVGITIASQSLDLENKHKWALNFARYVMYLLTVQASKPVCIELYEILYNKRKLDAQGFFSKANRTQAMMYAGSVAVIYLNDKKLYAEDFPFVFVAYLAVKYPEVATSTKVAVTYGMGMACSFIEGYLVHVVLPDGGTIKGLQDKIRAFEANNGVIFPVKRLFIIVTKSMHCPPDLKEFNDKSDREDVNRLEACLPLEEVIKDVAGVKNRNYKNSAYKIMRPNKKPVYIAAECATPLHTLYRVMKNRHLYEAIADVKVEDIVSDFVGTLRTVLAKSPEFKKTCELVCFDDTDENSNLSDVLLDKIRELEPNFEEFINRAK
ncbi:unnamed protein product [Arctia plantaginis]|uniref:STING ligand-binding domain-containing protein n=1 Tax=Arctia plantaginis TaxID=874455 RepID=A0A8S1ARV8_ARCPL|nr:unnamed protein product [Arctia plantaginis]